MDDLNMINIDVICVLCPASHCIYMGGNCVTVRTDEAEINWDNVSNKLHA